ncbi:EF-hand domain-containing protein [Thalassomonas haliotis]|uniref:EF-hand domain-containing protein n=1 Tax=Thalassomonas haliotis TaxID=485448 RepID=A0ABY7VI61_9GAMM|nr:EF-hand domain-containing protein [Thalassomonas haliotis]WDE13146.1 EF-hand domain-containing protein [Thalassomonas haliotis]
MKTYSSKLIALLSLMLCSKLSYGTDGDYRQNDRNERRGPPQFSQLDLDGDNSVTLDEFSQQPIPHGDHETIFKHIDSDGDGIITELELTSHKPPRRPRN